MAVQQLDEEILSPQTALILPFCPFNRSFSGSEIQIQVYFKAISKHHTDITGFFPITGENSEVTHPQHLNSEEMTLFAE